MKKTLAILIALIMATQVSAFASEEIVAPENTDIEIREEIEVKEEKPEKPEKVEKVEKAEKPEKEDIVEIEEIEEAEEIEELKGDEEKIKEEKEPKKRKFTKEELFTKRVEFKEKRIEAREYFKEIKLGFAEADAETRKLILEEIAAAKKELKDYSIGVFARGKEVDFEKYDGVKPRIENNRTLVPIRAITEALGAEVEWVAEENKVIITKGENQIILEIGSVIVLVNGETQECEVAPKIEKNRTLVPLRIVSESLRQKVEWDDESQTIVIEEEIEEPADVEEAEEIEKTEELLEEAPEEKPEKEKKDKEIPVAE